MSSGDYGDVGVGGLATAGGIGFLARKHGLTIDHVTAAELVLADGTLVRADADQTPTCCGRCAAPARNFGIVTALELDAVPAARRRVLDDGVRRHATPPACSSAGASWSRRAPRELTSFLYVFAQRGASPVVAGDHRVRRATTPTPRSPR